MTDSSTPDAAPSSVLAFSGIGVPPYSARGLTQSLAPIAEATQIRRTINGASKDLAAPQFRKYKTTIASGPAHTDFHPPAVSGVWPGKVIVVDCIAELCYPTGGTPEREVVETWQVGDFTFYRPRMTFRVLTYSVGKDEYGAENSWTMDMEEV